MKLMYASIALVESSRTRFYLHKNPKSVMLSLFSTETIELAAEKARKATETSDLSGDERFKKKPKRLIEECGFLDDLPPLPTRRSPRKKLMFPSTTKENYLEPEELHSEQANPTTSPKQYCDLDHYWQTSSSPQPGSSGVSNWAENMDASTTSILQKESREKSNGEQLAIIEGNIQAYH